ncbi:MAG: hypothetical protein IPK07_24435 [Deltaproteobacteria bacterium]|nr:hypothetical protein [Deltaproteobacteria bacterium]
MTLEGVNASGRADGANLSFDPAAVVGERGRQRSSGGDGLVGGLSNAVEEEREPSLPVAAHAYALEAVVVLLAALLEIEAQVEDRLAEQSVGAQDQGYQQPTAAAVAVEEWSGSSQQARQ